MVRCLTCEHTLSIKAKGTLLQTTRFMYARNIDDFLQRDLKALTFPRAFAIFVGTSMAFWTATSWLVRLMPLGRMGIRTIKQTSFYQTFGAGAVAGAFAMWGLGITYRQLSCIY
jgi:hypothetical protein